MLRALGNKNRRLANERGEGGESATGRWVVETRYNRWGVITDWMRREGRVGAVDDR